MIANYPKQHSGNLTTKHQNTSKWYKPMVRVFKNMRSRMVDDGLIKSGIAPSYYIEGLLYNVPNGKLSSSYQDCVVNTLNWYRQEASKTDLVCANEQSPTYCATDITLAGFSRTATPLLRPQLSCGMNGKCERSITLSAVSRTSTHTQCLLRPRPMPHNSMQLTALRAAADAER